MPATKTSRAWSCQHADVVIVAIPFARRDTAPGHAMPSLFRFIIFLGLIGGIAYGAVFSLANFVQLKPREIVVTIPPDHYFKQP
jgi:hypothetical protein